MPEAVGGLITWHLRPVDPADVLAPSDDLADKSLGRRERITLRIARMGVGRSLGNLHR